MGTMTMKISLGLALVALAFTVCPVAQEGVPHAQKGSIVDAVSLPGEMWLSSGTLSPFEKNNIDTQAYVEQRVTVFSTWSNTVSVTPYVSSGMGFDTKSYPWNNKVQPSAGIKLNKYFRSGVVSVGTAYTREDRFIDNGGKASGRIDFAQYWFGWNPVGDPKSHFPGSSWGILGHFSPVERGNLIEQMYVTQGVVAKRFGRTALLPYSEITLGHDSKGFDWENKAIFGGGVKVAVPAGQFYTEVGAGMMRENRFNSRQSASGIKVFVNFSSAWSLFGRKGH
jgi:hypothetical protein